MWDPFSWTVVGVLAPLAFGVGVSVLSMTPPEYRIARGCFWFTALFVLAKTGSWVAGGLADRRMLGAVVLVAVGTGSGSSCRGCRGACRRCRSEACRAGRGRVHARGRH